MPLLNDLNTLETAGLIRLAAVQPELEYLFRHALVQDAAYGSLLKNDRKHLHQVVGEALEALYPQQQGELAATLALHFEKAEAHAKALHYFTRAGDRASESYANTEALTFYQSAITQAESLYSQTKSAHWSTHIAQLHESIGDVCKRIGQHDTAKDQYSRAHDLQATLTLPDTTMQARLHRKIGATLTVQRQFAEAAQVWEKAESYLGEITDESAAALWDEWIEIQVERTWSYYWQFAMREMEQTIHSVLTLIEQRGTAAQQARALNAYTLYLLRRERFVVSDVTIINYLKNLQYALESKSLVLQADAYFGLGFCHLFRRELSAAEENLKIALTLAERIGSPIHIARAANYLMLVARMQRDIEKAQSYFPTILSNTWAGPMSDYSHQVKAFQAWMAWHAGKLEEARDLAEEAYKKMLEMPGKFPLLWIIVFVLLSLAVTDRQVAHAAELAQRVLEPSQMRLPDDLAAALEKGIQFAAQDANAAQAGFTEAIQLAVGYGFL